MFHPFADWAERIVRPIGEVIPFGGGGNMTGPHLEPGDKLEATNAFICSLVLPAAAA
ncbi:MAG: hypothetical protein ACHP8A_17380 [Terriglobales bacterium]